MNVEYLSNFDEIGYWSEVKLDIVKEYAKAYSTIMNSEKQKSFYHIYIDGFSGAGKHFSKTSQDFVPGSPLNALLIKPPFREFHLIDLDGDKIGVLKKIVGERQDECIIAKVLLYIIFFLLLRNRWLKKL
jgi:three-Cys-motif partner protein